MVSDGDVSRVSAAEVIGAQSDLHFQLAMFVSAPILIPKFYPSSMENFSR